MELAQNAVDAGGSRLLLRLRGDVLVAANDGAPLTDEGVIGLSTLRASGKRDGSTVGRYGVGFAAVLAVSDAPSIGSRGLPGVTWSRARVLAEIANVPALVDESARRGGAVPVLRLPYCVEPLEVPAGYDTVVVLPLLDVDATRALLADVDGTLPLVLPGLAELVIDVDGVTRTITCAWDADDADHAEQAVLDGRRWERASLSGTSAPQSPEDTGEWRIDAFAPVDGGLTAPQRLRAPTPTDEPLSLPVLLSVTAPLEPTRRRLVDGPLSRSLLASAGEVVATLMARLPDPRPLVPLGLPDGWVDAAVRSSLLGVLPEAPVLHGRPGSRCFVLEPGLEPVADLLDVDGLLDWPPSAALQVLGVRTLGTAEVLDLLGARTPSQWRLVYDALRDARSRRPRRPPGAARRWAGGDGRPRRPRSVRAAAGGGGPTAVAAGAPRRGPPAAGAARRSTRHRRGPARRPRPAGRGRRCRLRPRAGGGGVRARAGGARRSAVGRRDAAAAGLGGAGARR